MFKFKYLSVVLSAAVLTGVVVACNDGDKTNPKAEGIAAGTEMCGCVSNIEAPNIPTPPEGFDPSNIDYSDPATLEFLEAMQNIDTEAIEQAYFTALANCTGGVAGQYQEYITFDMEKYDVDAGLFSVFDFKNEDFKAGFLGAAQACADAFEFE